MSRETSKKKRRQKFDSNVDPAFLHEMIVACRSVVKHSAGADIDLYLADEKLRAAMDRWLYIICDGASNLSQEVLDRHRDIAWNKVIDIADLVGPQVHVVRSGDLMERDHRGGPRRPGQPRGRLVLSPMRKRSRMKTCGDMQARRRSEDGGTPP